MMRNKPIRISTKGVRIVVDQHTGIKDKGHYYALWGEVLMDEEDLKVGMPVIGMFAETNYIAYGEIERLSEKLVYFTLDMEQTYEEWPETDGV